jgi:hypothetical protein
MKRIVQTLVLTAFLAGTQSAWSIVRDRHEWMPKALVESPYPADAEASFTLAPFDTYADQHKGDRELETGDPFPANVAGIVIGD